MLELDLALNAFLLSNEALTEEQMAAFHRILELPDQVLWDMVSSREPPQDPLEEEIISKIHTALTRQN